MTSTLRPPGVPNRSATIGAPSTDSPISTTSADRSSARNGTSSVPASDATRGTGWVVVVVVDVLVEVVVLVVVVVVGGDVGGVVDVVVVLVEVAVSVVLVVAAAPVVDVAAVSSTAWSLGSLHAASAMASTSARRKQMRGSPAVGGDGHAPHDGVAKPGTGFLPGSQLAPSVFTTTPLIVIYDR